MKLTAIICALAICGAAYAQDKVVLENGNLRAEFDRSTGAMTGLVDKKTGWNVIPRSELGESFRMLVPKDAPGMPIEQEVRFNNADGTRQNSAPEVKTGRNKVTFVWDGITSDEIPELDIRFTGTVTLEDDGLLFSGKVENRSGYVVEYVAWPWLGEISIPDKPERFLFDTKDKTKGFYPGFPNESGYWGIDYPTSIAVLPADGFFYMHNSKKGMVISQEDVSDDELLVAMFEMKPGYDLSGRWSDEDDVDEVKVHVNGMMNHILYTKSDETSVLKPVRLTFSGPDIYKSVDAYRKSMPAPHSSFNWAGRPESWRRVWLSNPARLRSYAQECADAGIRNLVVRNWYRYVQYSMIEVLPEMKSAIEYAHSLGLRVILEDELFRTSVDGPVYDRDFKKLLQMDPHGLPYDNNVMCPLDSRLYEYIAKDYKAAYSSSLDADGFLCMDQNSRWRTSYCFADNHSHRSPSFIAPGVAALDRKFADAARKSRRNYLVGGSYMNDSQAGDFDFIYLGSAPRPALTRWLNPAANIVSAINLKYAREDINTCIMNRYSICFSDMAGRDDIREYPNVIRYASLADEFRNRYSDYIWNADFLSPDEAKVTGRVSWSVFRNRTDGRRAVVLVNYDAVNASDVSVSLVSGGSKFEAVSPENPEPSEVNSTISVPRLSCVVLLEK